MKLKSSPVIWAFTSYAVSPTSLQCASEAGCLDSAAAPTQLNPYCAASPGRDFLRKRVHGHVVDGRGIERLQRRLLECQLRCASVRLCLILKHLQVRSLHVRGSATHTFHYPWHQRPLGTSSHLQHSFLQLHHLRCGQRPHCAAQRHHICKVRVHRYHQLHRINCTAAAMGSDSKVKASARSYQA